MDKQARFESIQEMSEKYPIVKLCKIADVSRAGYYKWFNTSTKRSAMLEVDTILKDHILAICRLRLLRLLPHANCAAD